VNWVKVLEARDLAEGSRRVVEVDGEPVLLLRNQARLHAVQARCPHMGGNLAKGTVSEEGIIRCPLHHSAFDLATGAVKEWAPWPPLVGPALGAVRQVRGLRVYSVREKDGSIEVGLGEG
jgi:nitrite reductase/ring-hydroxylating ferredoxin subunit